MYKTESNWAISEIAGSFPAMTTTLRLPIAKHLLVGHRLPLIGAIRPLQVEVPSFLLNSMGLSRR